MRAIALTNVFFLLSLLLNPVFAVPTGPLNQDITRTFRIRNFNQININGSFNVILRQGDAPGLRVVTGRRDMKAVQVTTENGELRVALKEPAQKKVTLVITAVNLGHLVADGRMQIRAYSTFRFNELSIEVANGAMGNMSVSGGVLKIHTDGGCLWTISGKCSNLEAKMTGAGKLSASRLKSKRVNITMTGSGNAFVFPIVLLNAHINGDGQIRYRGTPMKIQKDIVGTGMVFSEHSQPVSQ